MIWTNIVHCILEKSYLLNNKLTVFIYVILYYFEPKISLLGKKYFSFSSVSTEHDHDDDLNVVLQGFVCPICMISLQSPEGLQQHFEEAHDESKQSQGVQLSQIYFCVMCNLNNDIHIIFEIRYLTNWTSNEYIIKYILCLLFLQTIIIVFSRCKSLFFNQLLYSNLNFTC